MSYVHSVVSSVSNTSAGLSPRCLAFLYSPGSLRVSRSMMASSSEMYGELSLSAVPSPVSP